MDTRNQTNEAAAGGSKLIYVVDDEPLRLELVTHILEGEGFEAQTDGNPGVALIDDRLKARKPALILTDCQMQNMNGLERVSAVRSRTPDMKVALVGGTVNEAVDQGLDDQPDAFLPKPYGRGGGLLRLIQDLVN